MSEPSLDLLRALQAIRGPSGDEARISEFVAGHCRAIEGTSVRIVGDLVIATRGKPRVAVFAHLDTIGFTQAYDGELVRLGYPRVEGGEAVAEVGGPGRAKIKVRKEGEKTRWLLPKKGLGKPGARWVFADPLVVNKGRVRGPYLDNRAGVWNGLRVLEECDDVAVLFTPNEEFSGRGAALGARLVYEELGITQALISDITWHTKWIKNGKGPAISLRDRLAPRQVFLDRVLELADRSGIDYQREVETEGGSDGHSLERSGYPVDWVFIGAPQKRCHTPREECVVGDLHGMVVLYAYLVRSLSEGEQL